MQVGKTVKRIAAISTAALMLGATLSGAFAASYKLADYAKPFLKDGVLDNTVIVVGKTAATSDVVGAIDVAAALQAEAVSKEAIETDSAVAPTIDNGVKVAKAGNVFNYGEDIDTVLESSSLDAADLPDMLGDGTFKDNKGNTDNEEDYEQSLLFTAGTGDFGVFQDDDLAKNGDAYLHFPQDGVYTYSLTFDQPIEFDPDAADADFEGTTIEIQGNTYTITDVNLDASDDIDEMTLVAGDSTVWLVQDQPYTLGDHTVTVVNVDDNGGSCGVNVDGKTVWVDEGSTEDFGGMNVGVLDVKVVHAKDYDQDTCELSLGSNEIVLKNGDVVTVNGADIDGSEVTFNNGVSDEWNGFDITFAVGDAESGVNSDDVYLAPGQAWTDPVFANFKVVYQGVTGNFEDMSFTASGEKADFTFMNNEGKSVKIPFFWEDADSAIRAGDDTDAYLLTAGQDLTDVNGGGLMDPEGSLLWYVTSGQEARILEVTAVEGTSGANANTTTIKDYATGDTLADKEDFTPGTATVISLGSLGSVNLTLTAGASGNLTYNVPAGGPYTAETKGEGTVSFTRSNVTLTEVDGDETVESTWILPLGWDTTDEELQIQNPTVSGGTTWTVDKSDSDSDNQVEVSERGTRVEWDSDARNKLTVKYPNADAYANVFVAPLDAEVASGSGSLEADKVNPFSVGLAVLDEDAESMTKNMIVVGGPCVNTVAAELMGNPEKCAEGFDPGKARLKFFERKDKAALLVAGYDAQDTVNAAYVLAQHNKKYATQFKTLGEEVELVVTDMNEVVFTDVTA